MAKNMTRRAWPRGGVRTSLPVTIYRRSSDQLHPDAQDWINRVVANGGTVSSATAGAVNQFCLDLENAPGGSIRDDESVAAANRLGVTLIVTGVRHFRH